MSLGFVPLALASWNSPSQARFIRRWGEIWSESQSRGARSHDQQERMDPVLLTSWIGMDNGGLTPLELTLRVWSACAHDWLGPHILESIASHIRRLAPADTPLEALETLAMQVMLTAQPIFDPRRARAWVKDFELPEEVELDAEAQPAEGQGHEAEPTTPEPRKDRMGNLPPPTPGLLGRLAATGLVIAYPQNKMRFVHPVLGGYLAGRALSGFKAEDTLLNQPDWIGKLLTMRYFAAHADAGSLVHLMLKWSRLPMHRPLLTIARWLRDAPRDASWRSTVMAALAELMQATRLPLSLRGQALAALIACGDTGVAALFRQMLNGSSDELAQLAALGSGAIRDEKAVSALEGMVQSTRPSERRAACLALVAIGTTPSLESVGHALLHGDDDLRRAAAESLANNEGEGHAMLKDGAGMADNLLRRAVVYGLGRVHQPWALELLEKARLEDEQWVVRNSANEVVEAENRAKDPRVPRPLRVPSETPWLITFAGTQGVGIAPHSPATDVLLAALKSTNAEERLAALEYLKHGPNEGVVKELYAAMFGTDAELREAAFLALWEIGASGYKLPDPTQFGLS
jgi:HEAT repeat protein